MPHRAALVGLITVVLPMAACGRAHRASPPRPPAATAAPGLAMVATVPEETSPPPRGKQITIAYASNLLGEYEPCG